VSQERHPQALVAALAVCLAGAGAGAGAATAEGRSGPHSSFTYVLPGDRVFPEGVAVDPQVKRYYVSSTSDGTILRGAITGRRARVFLPGGADGRTTAIGVSQFDKRPSMMPELPFTVSSVRRP